MSVKNIYHTVSSFRVALALALSVLSGLVLSLAALPSSLFFLNFIAFLPLFFAARLSVSAKHYGLLFLCQLLVMMVTFYVLEGRWILQTANFGFLIGLVLVLPFLVLLVPYIFMLKRRNTAAMVYFVSGWLVVEWIQSYFQLGTPFYNLGHSLAVFPQIIQWYEFTGASGGSLWILVVNVLLFQGLDAVFSRQKQKAKRNTRLLAVVLLLPVLLSLLIYTTYREKGKTRNVLVVHPSTENADVKYRVNIYELMDIYLGIIKPQLRTETDYVVLPETAITNTGWISDFDRNLVFQHWFEQTADFPNLKLISGAISYEAIQDVNKIKGYQKIPGIRFSEKYKTWYYTYNAALKLEREMPVQMRVKEGLVPYQEYAPYPRIMPRLQPVGVDFQFSTRANNQNIFYSRLREKTAALICYELVNSRLFYQKVQKGAEAFFVLLNEGWYADPEVPRQFLQLSVVRAIENRRSIAHSSNLGISAFVNQRGEVEKMTDSKQAAVLAGEIRMNTHTTLYAALGNYLGVAAALGMLFSALVAFKRIKPRNKTRSVR